MLVAEQNQERTEKLHQSLTPTFAYAVIRASKGTPYRDTKLVCQRILLLVA